MRASATARIRSTAIASSSSSTSSAASSKAGRRGSAPSSTRRRSARSRRQRTAMATDGQHRPPGVLLRAEGLTKRLGRRDILGGVTVEVRGGEVVGLLGPNGAGKTTTFYCVVGLLRPDGGTVSLNGV